MQQVVALKYCRRRRDDNKAAPLIFEAEPVKGKRRG